MSNPHLFAIPGLGAFGKPASGLNNRGGPEQGAAFCLWVGEECKRSRIGPVEKPGLGSESAHAPALGLFERSLIGRVKPFVLHGHRIDLTLSSRRRSNATEKGAFVSKGAPLRCAHDKPFDALPMRPGSPSIRRARAPTRDEGGVSSRVKRD